MIFTYGSDIGCGRSNNEDCFYIPKEDSQVHNVIMVADGMGGYNAGEIASRTAVESAVKYICEYGGGIGQNGVRSAMRIANNKIIEMVDNDARLKGMGTTMTMAVFVEGAVIIGHVGDSRAYLVSKKNQTIKQLTKDHSYVQKLIDDGEITLEQAYAHPKRNIITRALGVDRRVKIDIFERKLEEGDVVVLCTDGVCKFMSDKEIFDNINKDFFEGVKNIVNTVKEKGGDDNITIVAGDNKELLFDNRYKVVRQIGSGGMADVFCARDTKDNNKYVTIKLLKKQFYGDEHICDMFKTEANIAIKLKHKNIINAQKIIEEEDKIYIVLDYVEGENLKSYIKKHGPMDESEAISVGLQIARALRYAHNKGYIHKDVKPQNIILDKDHNAFLTDFGLATKDFDNPVKSGEMVLGSVYYFSPEHAKGEALNMRSDIYSFGIVLYELLCGKLPFTGESTHEVIMGHLHKEPASPNELNRDISVAISQVILKAINKDCELRYVNFNNLMADMKKALIHPDGGFVVYRHVPVPVKETSFEFNKLVVSILVIMSLFGILFMAGYTSFNNNQNQNDFGMPNVVNMNLIEAEKLLKKKGIAYRIEYYERNNMDSGIILNQSVKTNTEVPEGTAVVLGVSTNSKDTVMPNLIKVNRDDAVAFLNLVNINSISLEYTDSDLPYNFVVAQEPNEGASLNNVNSVKLYLSNNHTTTVVPNLVGFDLATAKSVADKSGFSLGIVYEEANKPEKINRQLPIDGEMQINDLSIDVWIGERKNKNVLFSKQLDLTIKEDGTKVTVCYEDDDGLYYYVDEFTLNVGIAQKQIKFYSPTANNKKIYIYYNNVKQRVVENVEAVKNDDAG